MLYMSDDDSINGDDDENVLHLSKRTLHRIDKAFDDAVKSSLASLDASADSAQTPERSSRRRWHPGADAAPGGFIVEDEPGGFIIETEENDPRDNAERPQTIPFSMIPAALQLLDLQPDDHDVLEVFRNAASGWGAGTNQEQSVSRKDWRAVCAVLTGNDIDDVASINTSSQGDPGQDVIWDEIGENDDYAEEDEEEDGEIDADEEYTPSPKKSTTRRKESGRKRRRKSSSLSSDEEATKVLSTRQKLECRKAFALFFADTSEFDSNLENKKIMIKDITRVANLLKEKLSAEDIIEMVEAFSSSTDKSVTLADFERIMIAAKLA